MAQSHVEISKNLNYKQPVSPIGADNYQYSTYFYNGRKAYNLKGFQIGSAPYEIVSIKLNPAGSTYVLLSRKNQKGSVEIFNLWGNGDVLFNLKDVMLPTAICYGADSRSFFVASEGMQLNVYETRHYTRKAQWALPFAASQLVSSLNGYFLAAVSGNNVAIVNQETGATRTTLRMSSPVIDIAFSEVSDQMGVLTRNGEFIIYDTRTFLPIHEFSDLAGATSFSFHPEGKYVGLLTNGNQVMFINLMAPADRPILTDSEGGMTYVRFLKDGKRQVYLTYNGNKVVKYRILKGLQPNLTKLLVEELNARMEEWSKMLPGETLEVYQNRVNEDTRLRQARLFEQQIATELAGGLIMESTITLGGYNQENNMLTLGFSNMPDIYLTVPENEVTTFRDLANLEFRDVVYGLTKDERFEMIYAKVYNKMTGKTYEFNNLERQSLDFLQSNDNFVPIELVQQSSMEDVKLQGIKNEVVSSAIQNNQISDHTNIKVSSSVVADVDADGRKITNYKVNFDYTVEGSYSIKEDFAAGHYKTAESNAAISMLNIVTRAFEQDFAQYIKPGKKVIVKLTGSADALKINGAIAYDGCYGSFVDEPYYLDGQLNSLTITPKTGIKTNEQLAFMRAEGVRDYITKHVPSLQTMKVDYRHQVELAEGTGGEFRRIHVEFIFVDAFDNK